MKKVALVTGSSRGIGRAVAAELARDGYAVCINYYERKDKADELVALLRAEGREAIAVQADVSKRSEVNAMVAQCERELGKITLLVNNAGVAGQALFQDVTDEMWERYFGVNLNGARNTIQAVLPNMLHEKSGCIVNISSIWGQHGASCEVTYSCTKHALIGLTRSLAMELAPSGIRVNCVAPGVIETDMVKVLGEETLKDLAEQTPLGRLGKPEDIAAAVAYLASDKASFVTGQVLAVDGAFVLCVSALCCQSPPRRARSRAGCRPAQIPSAETAAARVGRRGHRGARCALRCCRCAGRRSIRRGSHCR